MAQPNFIPVLSKNGNIIKNKSDGKTAQNILVDRPIIFWMSFVSWYSQIRAKIDTNGKEAITAATVVKRLLSSETLKIIKAERIIFYNILHR